MKHDGRLLFYLFSGGNFAMPKRFIGHIFLILLWKITRFGLLRREFFPTEEINRKNSTVCSQIAAKKFLENQGLWSSDSKMFRLLSFLIT